MTLKTGRAPGPGSLGQLAVKEELEGTRRTKVGTGGWAPERLSSFICKDKAAGLEKQQIEK